MFVERNYPEIEHFINEHSSALVLGPRGSGKTWYLKNLLKAKGSFEVINLLDSKTYFKYSQSPWLLTEELAVRVRANQTQTPHYCFIDEIQRIPELLNAVQKTIDEMQNEAVVFILSGSSARKLKASDANLLAGRALSCSFYPFSCDEVDLIGSLNDTLQWGSLPKCYLTKSKQIKTAFLQTYANTYLEEEIQKESEIRKLGAFSKFLELAATENGKIVNYSKVAKAANLHPGTVKEYFTILSDTLIATHVPAWSTKLRLQLQQSPKFFFFDCGVLNALTGNLQSELKTSSYRYGVLFENFVCNEIIRLIERKRLGLKVYHYRDQNQREIDLILQRNPTSPPVAVEIKSSLAPVIPARHIIRRFREIVPNSEALVICGADKAFQNDGLDFYPIRAGIDKALELALRTQQ